MGRFMRMRMNIKEVVRAKRETHILGWCTETWILDYME